MQWMILSTLFECLQCLKFGFSYSRDQIFSSSLFYEILKVKQFLSEVGFHKMYEAKYFLHLSPATFLKMSYNIEGLELMALQTL